MGIMPVELTTRLNTPQQMLGAGGMDPMAY
jgi:hypothetical protein